MGLLAGNKLRSIGIHGEEGMYAVAFWCPGCNDAHHVNVKPYAKSPGRPVWGWNDSTEKPTFTPSLLVQHDMWEPPVTPENYEQYRANPWKQEKVRYICHSFIRDGKIQFLSDCTHALKDQTVDIPAWPMTSDWD
jgi:hypothetical protein